MTVEQFTGALTALCAWAAVALMVGQAVAITVTSTPRPSGMAAAAVCALISWLLQNATGRQRERTRVLAR